LEDEKDEQDEEQEGTFLFGHKLNPLFFSLIIKHFWVEKASTGELIESDGGVLVDDGEVSGVEGGAKLCFVGTVEDIVNIVLEKVLGGEDTSEVVCGKLALLGVVGCFTPVA
jgi:hypothetical protein